MMHVKSANVLEYLKDSALFGNFGDDDEEVSIPEECYKVDTTVSNSKDLDDLLRTLRFWGVNELPKTATAFLLSSHRNIWESVAVNYERDLSCVADLIEIVNCNIDRQVCKATEKANVEVLTYLLEKGFPVEYMRDSCTMWHTSHAANIAARKGNLEMLKLLQQFNCPFHEDTVKAAALSGVVACLQLVINNGCLLKDDLANYAFASGSLDCLKYVHETVRCKWTNNLFSELESFPSKIKHNELHLLQCLQFAQKQGCPCDPKACEMCAIHGLPLLLQYLHEQGVPIDEQVIRAAAYYGNLDCLKYGVENGCKLPYKLFCVAVHSGSVDIIQYLFERGLPWPEDILRVMQYHDSDKDKTAICLAYAYKLGCPRDPNTCYYASMYGWLDILVDAHEHRCRWNWCCTREAAKGGHLRCLIYLHEHGCPWCYDSTSIALTSKNYVCLKYAIEHGCPTSNETMDKYKELVAMGNV